MKWGRPKTRIRPGLGDMVHKVASPIAGMIDAVAGTDLKNCGGCAGRREALNKLGNKRK
jgi:hypothetical protein